ncbi:MAG: SGNH/GDSL hydrolase family protein [Pyrinomonadaceae bacterium]
MTKKLVLFFTFGLMAINAFAQDGGYTRQKTWDAEINSMVETDIRQSPPKNPVIFAGSSSVRMWKTINTDFPGLPFINRAFGGSEFEDLNYYATRIIVPYKPKKLFVYEGDNDVNSGKSAERVLEDFKNFLEIVRPKLPKTKIYFISIKPSIARWKLYPEMDRANGLVREEARKHKNVYYVDVASKMLGSDGKPLPDIFLGDNLHMNSKGYAIWREVIGKYVW